MDLIQSDRVTGDFKRTGGTPGNPDKQAESG